MRNGGYVLDHRYFKTCGLQSADRSFSARAGALDEYFDGLQTMLHSCLCGSLSCGLSCEGGRLSAATEAHAAGGGPGNGVALGVGDGDHGVVEGRADMNLALLNVLTLSAACSDFFPLHVLAIIQYPSLLLLIRDGAFRALAGTSVGLAALAANGQAAGDGAGRGEQPISVRRLMFKCHTDGEGRPQR